MISQNDWRCYGVFQIIVFLLLYLAKPLHAQTCLPDGITFSTQEEVDDFLVNYPDCSIILGDVVSLIVPRQNKHMTIGKACASINHIGLL